MASIDSSKGDTSPLYDLITHLYFSHPTVSSKILARQAMDEILFSVHSISRLLMALNSVNLAYPHREHLLNFFHSYSDLLHALHRIDSHTVTTDEVKNGS